MAEQSGPGAEIVPRGAEIEEAVLDGEVVGEVPLTVVPRTRAVRPVTLPPHVMRGARHGALVAAGVVVAVRRWHASRTRHERMMRAAEVAGDHQAVLAWSQHRDQERHHRSERRRGRWETLIAVAKAAPWIIGAALVLPGVLGIFWAIDKRSPAAVADPYIWTAHAVALAVSVASLMWTAVTITAPVAILAVLHHLGRHAGEYAPRWAATSAYPDADVSIDETTVAQALDALRVPQIRDYLKSGMPLQYLVPCRRDGRGTYAEIRLPAGVTAERIARRRADLASGLYRLAKEVWPGARRRPRPGTAG
jgi:DNA segregation ATPase FtsK/SpoIIIE, S-DNA-T family